MLPFATFLPSEARVGLFPLERLGWVLLQKPFFAITFCLFRLKAVTLHPQR
jgi:hypothetical protein